MRTIKASLVAFSLSLLGSVAAIAAPATGPVVQQPAPPTGVAGVEQTAAQRGRPKLALSLGGGGGRGGAHIGVLKVLEANGIKPDFVTGSSIGAVIGSLYCAGVPVSRIEQMALDGELRKAMMPGGLRRQAFIAIPRYALMRLAFMHPKIGLYNGKSVTKFIERNLPQGEEKIENLKIPFAAIATNLLDTRPVWISKGSVAEAVRASTSLPFMYQSATTADGKVLIDGGVRENLPTEAAQATGPSTIIAVKLNGSLEKQAPEHFRNFLDYSDRVMTILMSEIESKTNAAPDVVIEPVIKNTKTYTFSGEDMAKAIAAGEQAANKMLPEIRQKLMRNQGTASTGSGPQ